MDTTLSIPPDIQTAMQRLQPYMSTDLRNDPGNLKAIALFLKLGGEKLARIAIDAHNQTYRMRNAQAQRLRLKQSMLNDPMDTGDQTDSNDKDDETDETDDDNDELPEY